MKCPRCGCILDSNNYCSACCEFFDESDLSLCPQCGNQLDEDNYCCSCFQYFNDDECEDIDFDSMVGNGDEICLNCTYWSVSPYGASHGMICRRGYPTSGPGDFCADFVRESHFANYGDSGQYQFNETERAISNKLYHWKNNR